MSEYELLMGGADQEARVPPPSKVFKLAAEELSDPFYDRGPNDKGIGIQLGYSIYRVLTGYFLAALVALPYLILSAAPKLVEKMPRTGPGSVLIKQIMGLFMLAAAAYFIGVGLSAVFSTPPNPTSKLYWWPVMGFFAAGGIWLAFRTLSIAQKNGAKIIFTTLGVMLIGLSSLGAISLTDEGPINWVYYTPERYEELLNQNKVVVMVFTAEWCLNCKVLEEGVLRDPKIIKIFESGMAVPVKVDITGNNPAGKAKLKEVGNLTIPLLVIFSPNGKHVFKSDFYTVEQVLNAVNKAVKKPASTS